MDQKKIKVAFYMDNRNIKERNLKEVKWGNPGIGGSHYMQILLAANLAQQYKNLSIKMYMTKEQVFPQGIECEVVRNIEEALAAMKREKRNVFILSNWYDDVGSGLETLKLIEKSRIKTIIWAHIFMNREQYAYISRCKYIRLFVCLGKQQLEMMRGLRLYQKSTYINYMLPPVNAFRQVNDENIIVYVGAMYPYKGFHILAKYWRYIKENVPDAKLWVIGSAKLYGDNIVLGKYKIAEAEYERQFIHYLLDSDGKIDSSIKFFGNVGGSEKEKIVSQATVGIFNPCGISETFGLSGVEFEAMGIPVVSIHRNSSLDIIKHKKTGLLYKKEKDFPEYIIRLLKDREYNQLLGKQGFDFVHKKFETKKILEEWYCAIISIATNLPYQLKHNKTFMLENQIPLHCLDNYYKEHIDVKKAFWDSILVTGK